MWKEQNCHDDTKAIQGNSWDNKYRKKYQFFYFLENQNYTGYVYCYFLSFVIYPPHLMDTESSLTHSISWCLNLSNPLLKRLYPSLCILPIVANILEAPLPVIDWLTRVMSQFMVLFTLVYMANRSWAVFSYIQETLQMYQSDGQGRTGHSQHVDPLCQEDVGTLCSRLLPGQYICSPVLKQLLGAGW